MDNFQQTVDLRKNSERQKPASPLEKIYREEKLAAPDLQKISRPKIKQPREGLIKLIVFALAILIAGASVYFLFFKNRDAADKQKSQVWYAVKLANGEIFYGQVFDVKADPVVIDNVYYNYDQAKQAAAGNKDLSQSAEETGNLRLVKRGKETHGPDGSMDVVRSQILFMEPLKADSKVLKAILDYEK